jgi:hypothetical protein
MAPAPAKGTVPPASQRTPTDLTEWGNGPMVVLAVRRRHWFSRS